MIQPAQQVQQRGLAGAGRAHDGDELALGHQKSTPSQRVDCHFTHLVVSWSKNVLPDSTKIIQNRFDYIRSSVNLYDFQMEKARCNRDIDP